MNVRRFPRPHRLATSAVAGAALLGTIATAAMAGESVTTARLAGDGRDGTAIAIAQRVFPDGSEVTYLARSDDPVDAVAGGSLTDGPILLVPTCGDLPDATAAELARLGSNDVIALGGSAAICDNLLNQAADAAAGVEQDRPAPGSGF